MDKSKETAIILPMVGPRRKILLYGGCTGIGKSDLLNSALAKVWPDEDRRTKMSMKIKISDEFIKEYKFSKKTKEDNIIWQENNWKKYDGDVISTLTKTISTEAGDRLVIINQHFSTISAYGYVPGLNMESLDKLANLQKNLYNGNIAKPCFGILLIDTDQRVLYEYYREKYKYEPPILQYISLDNIQKDLEENRKWAELYSTRVISILGANSVYTDTIYIESAEPEQARKCIESYIKILAGE